MAPVKKRISDGLKVTRLSVAELCLESVATQDWLTGWSADFSSGPMASADTTALEEKVHNELSSRGQPVPAHLGNRYPGGSVRPWR